MTRRSVCSEMLHALFHICHLKTVLYIALVPGASLGSRLECQGVMSVQWQYNGIRGIWHCFYHTFPFFLLPRLTISAFHPTQTLLPVVSIRAVMLTEEKWWGRSQGAPESTEIRTLNRSSNPEGYYPFSPKPSCSFNFLPHQDKSGGLHWYLWTQSLAFPFQPNLQAQHNF